MRFIEFIVNQELINYLIIIIIIAFLKIARITMFIKGSAGK
jgi:hypothetical protein